VGAVPLTRECLESDQVRHEIVVSADGTVDVDADPETAKYMQLEAHNKLCCDLLSASGFDGDKLRAKAPEVSQKRFASLTKKHTKERQEVFLQRRTAGHHFHATGGDTLNGDDFFKALKRQDNQATIKKLETEKKSAMQ
jgi:ketol-acid reductoisomerase